MRKCIAALLAILMVLSLTACGSDSAPASQPPAPKQEQPAPEPEKTPQEIAEDIDGAVNVFVQLATNSMNELTGYIGGFGSKYTADNLLDYAKTHISDGYDWKDSVEELCSDIIESDYFVAANDCMMSSLASWLFLKEYLENGDSADLNNMANNVGIYPNLVEAYTAERHTYLESAGFSAEEAESIINIVKQSK